MATRTKRGERAGGKGAVKPAPQADGPKHTENPNMPAKPGNPENPMRPGDPDYPDQPREAPAYRKPSRNPYQE